MSVIKIIIPNTSLVVSKFIFGTSRLHKIFSKKERYNILKCAVDNGFTHFDTAPYYGFGLAEASLKEILKENSNLTITTKVGLYSPGGSNQNISNIWMRKISGKLFAKLSKPIVNFTINQAEKSLEENLNRLGKDCLDIFMLHEPSIDLLSTDEWKIWLENLIKKGKIKFYGLALNSKNLKTFIDKNDKKLFNILQIEDSLSKKEADILKDNNLPYQITYGYFSKEKKILDFQNVIKKILNRNSTGAIIVSSLKQNHIEELSRSTEKIND